QSDKIQFNGVFEYESMLSKELQNAQQDLAKINEKLLELFDLLEKQTSCLTIIERSRAQVALRDFQNSKKYWEEEIIVTQNARRKLKSEREYLFQKISNIKEEQKLFKKYLKVMEDLEKINVKIKSKEIKKQYALKA
ncbi:MAG TPA: hypothetical protein VHM20_04365, partial [Gammaproteobacteria bacterium]|nr:hypothetical protein [Gammaproteobacteria bacterium]